MADIEFSMTSDEKDVIRGLQASGKAMGKLREDIAGLVTASKEAGAADNQIAQQRLAALEAVVTKQKALKAQQETLAQQLKDGKITADEYRKSFDGIAKESNALTTELKQLQTAVSEDSRDLKRAGVIIGETEDKTEKYARAVAELNRLKERGILTSKQHANAMAAEQQKLEGSKVSADGFGGALGPLAGKIGAAAAGFVSMGAVIATIRMEYENLIEKQGKSRDANISLAAEEEALLMNLGGADAGGTIKSIGKLSKDTGVKQEVITRAVNEAMAARADLDVSDIVNAAGSVAKIRKFAPAEMAGLTAATIDTQKQTGLGTDASLGFLLQLQAQSRTKNLKGLAENFTPAVGGVMNFGADRETAGAMLAALSHGMGDTTGAQTGTSAIQLAKQLREFSGGADIGKTIAQMQRDPALRQQFLGKASFEAKALPAVESLLSGGTQAKQFASARQALAADPLAALNQAIKDRGASGAIGIAEVDQRLGNAANQLQIGDKRGATSAVVRDRMKEIRQAMGGSAIGTKMQGIIDDVGAGGAQSIEGAISNLEDLQDTSRSDVARRHVLAKGAFRNDENFQAGTKQAAEQLKMLDALVQELKGLRADNAGKAHAGVVAGRAAQREGDN